MWDEMSYNRYWAYRDLTMSQRLEVLGDRDYIYDDFREEED